MYVNDIWETPNDFFNVVDNEFNFNYDLSCNTYNCKCIDGSFFDKGINGLLFNPSSLVNGVKYSIWCNPPYNRIDKPKFIKKCFELSKNKCVGVVVMLLPVSTSTKIFHNIILPNSEIRFIKGRIKFKGVNSFNEYNDDIHSYNDSMLIIFRNNE